MTELQVYLLIAPLILLAVGWAATIYWIKRSDREDRRAKHTTPR
jgi:hypothetical protein